jgi:diguanylate cyclase (GGDEF)-like protein
VILGANPEMRVTSESTFSDGIEAAGPVLDGASDTPRTPELERSSDGSAADTVLVPSFVPGPDGWADALTGTEGPRYWDRILANEEARRHRYGRPVTVAIVEFTGFESAPGWLSADLGLQFFARLSRVLAGEVRSSDHVARIGPTRFGIILVETDEVSAINFVDRVRKACGEELQSAADFGVRIGWASPPQDGSLQAALSTAEVRLRERLLQGD